MTPIIAVRDRNHSGKDNFVLVAKSTTKGLTGITNFLQLIEKDFERRANEDLQTTDPNLWEMIGHLPSNYPDFLELEEYAEFPTAELVASGVAQRLVPMVEKILEEKHVVACAPLYLIEDLQRMFKGLAGGTPPEDTDPDDNTYEGF